MHKRGFLIVLLAALLLGSVPAQAIVNGSPLNTASWKFLVAVGCSSTSTAPSCADRKFGADANGMNAPQFCGGSLITPQIVVTAAHCIYPKPGEELKAGDLIVGGNTADLTQIKSTSTYSNVVSITVHPKYNTSSQVYDVAILTLNRPISGTSPIGYSTTLPKAGDVVEVAGWGEINSTGKTSPIATSATLTMYSDQQCAAEIGDTFEPNTMQCALGKNGGLVIDACHGDSGGPLIGTIDGVRKLVGSVSWGSRCADGKPGIYTKLPAMISEVLTITPPPPAIVDFKKNAPGTPATPKNVSLKKNGTAVINIPSPTDGQDVEFWTLSCAGKSGKFGAQAQSTAFAVGGLKPKSVYTCKVKATNSLGTSGWSKPFTIK